MKFNLEYAFVLALVITCAIFLVTYLVRRVKRTFASGLALLLLPAVLAATGCTPAQKQTTLQIVTAINTHIPEVVSAADTVAAVVSGLLPVDAALIGVTDVAFDTAAHTIQALTASYIANPSASVLAQIQAAITTLEGQLNTATLSVAGIKNAGTQQAVLAVLKGLLTVVTVVFALISPTMTTSQLRTLRDTHTIQLAKVRPYMDEQQLRTEAKASGVDVEKAFAQAEAFGF